MDLIKQFFSFDKLMKDKLVAAFFYLGLVIVVVKFLGTIKAAFSTMDDSVISGIGLLLTAFFQILFLFIFLRLIAELMIAIFHINDNVSPDGGKSDTAELDVIVVARDAATKAAKSASVVTKSVVDKTRSKLSEIRDDDDDDDDEYPDYEDPTPKPTPKPARKPTASRKPSARKQPASKARAVKKTPAKKQVSKKTTAKTAVEQKPAPKRKKPAAKK